MGVRQRYFTAHTITEGLFMISPKRNAYVILRFAILALLFGYSEMRAETPQERVHQHSHHIMPFDMAKTLHVFRMTESGGTQKVLVRDSSDTIQIGLIRQHLSHEAKKFAAGDYSDPAKLHGTDMPGLAELRTNPSKVKVTYSDLPTGAQINFETKDLNMITAVHRWFGAQLSEHGADARAE